MTGPKETVELMHVTWLSQSQRVKVSFRGRQNDGAYTETTVRGGGGIQPALPLGPAKKDGGKERRMAFRPPPPIEMKVKYGVGWGVEYGAAFEYDIKGKLVERHELTPLSYSVEIPVPQGGGGIRD